MTGVAVPRKKRNDTAVKIESEIARQAKTMCSYRDITIAEYLSEILRGPVSRDFEKFRKELGLDKFSKPLPARDP